MAFAWVFVGFHILPLTLEGEDPPQPDAGVFGKERFEALDLAGKWETSFFDSGIGDREDGNWLDGKWRKKWFLDGEIASVRNTRQGLLLAAGPRWRDDAHHMVLWTHESFAGDVKIEYEFTRADFEDSSVLILYIQATGSGEGLYEEDISAWKGYRSVPRMSKYFRNLNTYHISYATGGPHFHGGEDYVRGRRYNPAIEGLRGSEIAPEYADTGLWKPGVTYKMTTIKADREIAMKVEGPGKTAYFYFHNEHHPTITHGRIGLRQMFTRSSYYKNIRISERAP